MQMENIENQKFHGIPELNEIEKYSVEELEELAIELDRKMRENKLLSDSLMKVLRVRQGKLNRDFEFTRENINKLLQLDCRLMECFEKLKKEGEHVVQNLKKRINNNDSFLNDYEVEAVVTPLICVRNEETGKMQEVGDGIYRVLLNVILIVFFILTVIRIYPSPFIFRKKQIGTRRMD